MPATPESGERAGDDGHKRRKGAKVQAAVETLGHLLAVVATPANEQDRAPGEDLAAATHGIRLAIVKLPEAKRGFVLLPRRWVVERDFAWATRFRRLARDYERLAATLAAFHFLAFACLMLHRFTQLTSSS